jgi:GH15 family glucan-1,4-alpha-glucosidase
MELVARFGYGKIKPWLRRDHDAYAAIAGPDALALRTRVPIDLDADETMRARFDVSPGERVPFLLTYFASHRRVPKPLDALRAIDETTAWWLAWSDRCGYEGPYADHVKRSLITLKALTYGPTGGIVAAPTTSLPESIGGVRNWDYRYCWVRDATFTLFSLMSAGYKEEAQAWRDWLLRAVAGSPAQFQIMYGPSGERRLTELELDWLPGYENSRPVRIGNAAVKQFQLDVYGEIMDALHQARRVGIQAHEAAWKLQTDLVDFVRDHWQEPDEGIWEVRGDRQDFTHSKMMAWVAVDRAVQAIEQLGLAGPVDAWRALRDRIHAEVCERGFNRECNAFTQAYGSTHLDASLLMMPMVGFLPATDPRVRGTIEAIQKHLCRDGFVLRYESSHGTDGLPPGEGAFLACTFWLADSLALLGRQDEARAIFENLLGLCNDVGLLSEEYDHVNKRLVGNFPQAFSHVALVNSARNVFTSGGPARDRPSQRPPAPRKT